MGLLDEYNTQEAVTLGYGLEMWKQGFEEGFVKGWREGLSEVSAAERRKQIETNIENANRAITDDGLSDKLRRNIVSEYRRLLEEDFASRYPKSDSQHA